MKINLSGKLRWRVFLHWWKRSGRILFWEYYTNFQATWRLWCTFLILCTDRYRGEKSSHSWEVFFFLKQKASDYFLVFPCWQFHYCHPEENESHKGIAVLLSKLTKKLVQWWQRKMLTTSSRTLLIWGKEMISSIRYILWLHNIQKTWLNCQWY